MHPRAYDVVFEDGRRLVVVAPSGRHLVAGLLRHFGLEPDADLPACSITPVTGDHVLVLDNTGAERLALRARAETEAVTAAAAMARMSLAEQQLHEARTELASARRLLLEAREIAPLVQIRLGTPGESFLTALAEYKS